MAAGWDRYNESKKYTKEDGDTNKNPKHVGESLRTLTLEDRLEIRRQQREIQKKRKTASTQALDLADDEDDDAADDLLNGEPPAKKTKDTGPIVLGEDDDDLPASSPKGSNGSPSADKLVELDDDDDGLVEVARTNGKSTPKAVGRRSKARSNDGKAVEDLEAVSKPAGELAKPVRVLIEQPDPDASPAASQAASRRAKRKAAAGKANAQIQVLE